MHARKYLESMLCLIAVYYIISNKRMQQSIVCGSPSFRGKGVKVGTALTRPRSFTTFPRKDHGTIIEKGTHEELLAKNGFYADLYNSQFTGRTLLEEAV